MSSNKEFDRQIMEIAMRNACRVLGQNPPATAVPTSPEGNGPVSCATMRGVVTIEKFPAGSYRVIVVLEPSPSPLDGAV